MRRIWDVVMGNCLVSNAIYNWDNLVDWGAAHLKGKGLRACLKGLLIGGSSVYHISLQRNSIVNINGTMWSGEWNLMLFSALRFKM